MKRFFIFLWTMTIIFPFEMRAEGAEDSVIVSHTISEEKELAVTEEPKDSISVLQAFLEKNRQCWAKEIIYEGCSVLLNSDGESLFVQLKILHPALQMRLLMQGMTVSVDPTGRKKEKYQTVIPSATDVREQMQGMEPTMSQEMTGMEQRPDIRPLLAALTSHGAVFDVNGKYFPLDKGTFAVDLEEKEAVLVYSVLIPVEQMLKEKKLEDTWSLGIYSKGGQQKEGGPGFGGGPGFSEGPGFGKGPESGQIPDPNRPDGVIQGPTGEDMFEFLVKNLEEWIEFSFSEICSLNG